MVKDKKSTHICPYCKTSYRHKGMADRCMKTQTCRTFNAPSETRRNALNMQVGVGAVIEFIISMLLKQKNGPVREMAQDVEKTLGGLYSDLGKLRCANRFIAEICAKAGEVLTKIWPPDEDTDAIHLLAVASALIVQLRQDMQPFWDQNPVYDGPKIWKDLESDIDKIYDYFNAELSEDYPFAERVPEAYDTLYAAIWPEYTEKPMPKLRLYLVNDRYWVAAEGKANAKELVSSKYKCQISSCEGIKPTEIFEDGSSASTLLESAKGSAGILAENIAE